MRLCGLIELKKQVVGVILKPQPVPHAFKDSRRKTITFGMSEPDG